MVDVHEILHGKRVTVFLEFVVLLAVQVGELKYLALLLALLILRYGVRAIGVFDLEGRVLVA